MKCYTDERTAESLKYCGRGRLCGGVLQDGRESKMGNCSAAGRKAKKMRTRALTGAILDGSAGITYIYCCEKVPLG
jgi:hypothetical protein